MSRQGSKQRAAARERNATKKSRQRDRKVQAAARHPERALLERERQSRANEALDGVKV